MIINVRGSNGSGKSTISHKLIDGHKHEGLIEPEFLEGVTAKGEPYHKNFKKENAFVIGNLVVCGRYQAGMDGYLPHETIEDTLRYWAQRPGIEHIVFENVLVSGNAGDRWTNLFDQLKDEYNQHTVMAIMATPQQECVNRILGRRASARAGGFKHRQTDEDLNYSALKTHWKRVRRIGGKMYDRGYDVRWVDGWRGYDQVHDLLLGAGWSGPQVPPPLESSLLAPDLPLLKWEPTEEELTYLKDTALFLGEDVPEGWVKVRGKSVAKPTPLAVATASTIPEVHPLDELGDPFDF